MGPFRLPFIGCRTISGSCVIFVLVESNFLQIRGFCFGDPIPACETSRNRCHVRDAWIAMGIEADIKLELYVDGRILVRIQNRDCPLHNPSTDSRVMHTKPKLKP